MASLPWHVHHCAANLAVCATGWCFRAEAALNADRSSKMLTDPCLFYFSHECCHHVGACRWCSPVSPRIPCPNRSPARRAPSRQPPYTTRCRSVAPVVQACRQEMQAFLLSAHDSRMELAAGFTTDMGASSYGSAPVITMGSATPSCRLNNTRTMRCVFELLPLFCKHGYN